MSSVLSTLNILPARVLVSPHYLRTWGGGTTAAAAQGCVWGIVLLAPVASGTLPLTAARVLRWGEHARVYGEVK